MNSIFNDPGFWHRLQFGFTIPGSGQIVLNGAAAFQGKRGDVLTIMSFAHVPKHKVQHWKPRVIVLGKRNRIVKERGI